MCNGPISGEENDNSSLMYSHATGQSRSTNSKSHRKGTDPSDKGRTRKRLNSEIRQEYEAFLEAQMMQNHENLSTFGWRGFICLRYVTLKITRSD